MTASVRPDSQAIEGSDALVAELVEEFTNLLQAGQAPDPEAFAARHPAQAERLRQLLPALHVLAALSRPSGAERVPGTGNASEPAPATLGDYRILREVGKGGMGVVYEAHQMSLSRRVALKVLPFAATMDPRQLQRFHNEALAAAHLDHPHIVDVYGVGCERGVHFYAMRFIEGHTLAQIVDQLRALRSQEGAVLPNTVAAIQPRPEHRAPRLDEHTGAYTPDPSAPAPETVAAVRTVQASGSSRFSRSYFRSVSQLGAQLAEALDHAHQMGVVHRDIKPSNLMLDVRGKVWITDFGLARLESAASLSVTGDLIGTLRYMSPEQALAKRVPVDHRSDIYSLGVTLYELLTLEPAVGGKDRQELLRQIAFEEPRPPRRLCREVPAELETIVLKAIEKNAQDRYATARELADDLHHFLHDQPIRARRPSVLLRLRKWGRRHQAVVGTAALGLLLALVIVAGSIGWIVRDRNARQEKAEQPVQAAIEKAEALWGEKRIREALSEAERAEGLVLHAGGHPRLGPQVQELVKDLRMLVTLEEIRLTRNAARDARELDPAVIDQAFGEAFRAYGIDVEALSVHVAADRIRACRIGVDLVIALDTWASTRMEQKGNWRGLLNVARAAEPPNTWRGRLRTILGASDEAALAASSQLEKDETLPLSILPLLVDALRSKPKRLALVVPFLRRAQQQHPDDFWLNLKLAFALHEKESPQLDEAIRFYQAAIAVQPRSPGARLSFGVALEDKGRLDEAIIQNQEALRLQKDYALAHYNLGNVLRKKDRLDEAIAEYRRALRLKPDYAAARTNLALALGVKGRLDEAIAELHEAVRRQPGDSQAHYNLGGALKGKGKLEDAIAAWREAIRVKPDYAEAYNNLGAALADKGQRAEAIAEYRNAIRVKPDHAPAYYNLGDELRHEGRLKEAIDAYRQAIRLSPDFPEAHCNLGLTLKQQGQFVDALACYRRGHQLGSRNPRWRSPSARWVKECERLVELDRKLPAILSGKERPAGPAEQVEYAELCQFFRRRYASAASLYQQALASQPSLENDPPRGHRYNAACSAALAGSGQGDDAGKLDPTERSRWQRQALDWLRADLALWSRQADNPTPQARTLVQQKLRHWQSDSDLTGLRAEDALAKLSPAERKAWQQLWQDVATTLARASRPASTKLPAPGKP